MQMRTLAGVKEYFKDVYTDWLKSDRYGKELDRITMMTEVLHFIYGTDFDEIEAEWRYEAIDEFYTGDNLWDKEK